MCLLSKRSTFVVEEFFSSFLDFHNDMQSGHTLTDIQTSSSLWGEVTMSYPHSKNSVNLT